MSDVLHLGKLGLRTAAGASGDPAEDGLARAENVVSKPGRLEPVRGLAAMDVISGKDFRQLGAFDDQLVLLSSAGELYLYDLTAGTYAAVPGLYQPAAGARVRLLEGVETLFVGTGAGFKALDAPTAPPLAAGAPAGLDTEVTLGTANGTAIAGDGQVAYRAVFGRRDAHGRLILGAPGGRTVVESPVIACPVGSLSRSATTVTWQLADEDYAARTVTTGEALRTVTGDIVFSEPDLELAGGEVIRVSGDDPAVLNGVYTVSHFSGGLVTCTGALAPGSLTQSTVPITVEKMVPHGLSAGEKMVLTGGDAAITDGTYTISITNPAVFTFTHGTSGTNSNTSACTLEKTTRDATVGATIPAQAKETPDYFCRFYRSPQSASYVAPPLDEMSLVAEVPVPQPVALSALARSGSTVTATTAESHRFSPGTLVTLPTGLPGAAGELLAVGADTHADRSTDGGSTWVQSTLAGSFRDLNWTGTNHVVVGLDYIGTSPTGETWTSRTVPTYTDQTRIPLTRVVRNTDASVLLALAGGSPLTAMRYAGGQAITIPSVSAPTEARAEGAWTSEVAVDVRQPCGAELSVSASLTLGGVVARRLTLEAQYRRAGGAWLALGSETHSFASSDGWTFHPGFAPYGTGVELRFRLVIEADPGAGSASATSSGTGTRTYGQASTLIRSTDGGTTWAKLATPDAGYVFDVAHDGSRFVRVGVLPYGPPYGRLCYATSVDGLTWTATTEVGAGFYLGAAASNKSGRTVVVGRSQAAIFDGSSWTTVASPPVGDFTAGVWDAVHQKYVFVGVNCSASSPDGLTWTPCAVLGDLRDVAMNGSTAIAVGRDACRVSTDAGASWSTVSPFNGDYYAVGASPGVGIPAGTYTVATAPSSTTFTFAQGSGTVASTPTAQVVTPQTVAVVDTVAPDLLGESAYWNASQGGVISSHDLPPDCYDAAMYRDHAFYAAPRWPAVTSLQLLAVGAKGLQPGNAVVLPGGTVTAGATENWATRTFKVHVGGSTLDVHRTILSFCRVVNRNPGLGVTAVPLPDPGALALVSTSHDATLSVSFTTTAGTTPWSPSNGTTVPPARMLNQLAFSLPGIPDAVPALNTYAVGRAGRAILRVVPLPGSCLILKEDGVYRLTGSSSVDFAIHELDPDCRVFSETARAAGEVCLALSDSGVVSIRDTGVTNVSSADIGDQLEALLSPSMLPTTKSLSFGLFHETDGLYTVWAPTSTTDTLPTKGWTYSLETGLWTTRSDSFAHVIFRPTDGRLYAVKGDATIYRERKGGGFRDHAGDRRASGLVATAASGATLILADASAVRVGDALEQGSTWANVVAVSGSSVTLDHATGFTLNVADINCYAAIRCVVEWNARYVPSGPQRFMHARELALLFGDVQMALAYISTASDLDGSDVDIPLVGSRLALHNDPTSKQARTIRTLVARQHARCSRLNVAFTHEQAYRPFSLEGLSLTYSGGGDRFGSDGSTRGTK